MERPKEEDYVIQKGEETNEMPIGEFLPVSFMAAQSKFIDHLEKQNQWISIETPPKSELGEYIVCLKNNAIFMANYSTLSNRGFWHSTFGNFDDKNHVTHWLNKPRGANKEDL